MTYPVRLPLRVIVTIIACFLFTALFALPALAEGSHDRVQFGNDITVGPNEEIGEATCFGCTVRVRGHVTGDITVFGGSILVEDQGEVGGDITIFGGSIRLDKSVKVGGDMTAFGAHIRRDPEATVGGDVTTFGGPIWIVLIFGLPFLIFAGFIALIVWLVRRLTRPSVPVAA
jgi:hypothetical protein